MTSSQAADLYKIAYIYVKPSSNDTVEIRVIWTFPRFNLFLRNPPIRDISTNKNEIADFDENYKFRLRMKIFGRNSELVEFYYLAPKRICMKCNLSIVSQSQHNHSVVAGTSLAQTKRTISVQDTQWVEGNRWNFFGQETQAFNCINITNPVDVKLEFVFTISNSTSDDSNPQQIKMAKLNNDFEYLLNNPILSDVIIKSNDGVEINSHKVVLATRSPVFRANFEHEMLEKLTNIVESPFDIDVLQAVMTYMYTDKITKVDQIPEDILKAADFYNLNGLKTHCEYVLHKKLTVENVIKTLEFADMYSAPNLKKSCLEFISTNNDKEIIKTKGWEEMKSMELFKQIAEHFVMNK